MWARMKEWIAKRRHRHDWRPATHAAINASGAYSDGRATIHPDAIFCSGCRMLRLPEGVGAIITVK